MIRCFCATAQRESTRTAYQAYCYSSYYFTTRSINTVLQ